MTHFASLHHSPAALDFFFYCIAVLTVILDSETIPLLSLVTLHSMNIALFSNIFNRFISSPFCSLVMPLTAFQLSPESLFRLCYPSSTSTYFVPPISLFLLRCGPCRAREALHTEATAVLCSFRLPVRPAEWPEMEGGEAGGAERNGGVHHPQQECHHRAHLPGGGAHGQWSWRG